MGGGDQGQWLPARQIRPPPFQTSKMLQARTIALKEAQTRNLQCGWKHNKISFASDVYNTNYQMPEPFSLILNINPLVARNVDRLSEVIGCMQGWMSVILYDSDQFAEVILPIRNWKVGLVVDGWLGWAGVMPPHFHLSEARSTICMIGRRGKNICLCDR